MPETAVSDKPASEASGFAEYKLLRSASQPAVKETDPPAESDKSASESETVSETVKGKPSQDGAKPKDRSANERIRELSAKNREAEAKLAQQAKELEELRNRHRTPEPAPKPVEAPKPTTEQAKPADEKPKFSTFFAKAQLDPANTTWEAAQSAAQDAYNEALWEHRRKAEEADRKKAEDAKQAESAKSVAEAKRAKTVEKFPDFDAVIGSFNAPDIQHNQGIQDAINASDTFEVLYHLAKNVDDMRRISALSPQQAYREVVKLDLKLSSGAEATRSPEKQRQPVPITRAPAPPNPVAASTVSIPADPKTARNLVEYKRLKSRAV